MANRWPTGEDMRRALMARCDAWCARRKAKRYVLSVALTNNPAFLDRVEKGGNLTIATYDKCMAKLDELGATKARPRTTEKQQDGKESKAKRPRRKGGAVPQAGGSDRGRQGVGKGNLHGALQSAE